MAGWIIGSQRNTYNLPRLHLGNILRQDQRLHEIAGFSENDLGKHRTGLNNCTGRFYMDG